MPKSVKSFSQISARPSSMRGGSHLRFPKKRVPLRKAPAKRRAARKPRAARKALRTVQTTLGQATQSKCMVLNPRAHTKVAAAQKLIGQTQNWNQSNGQRVVVGVPGQAAYDFPILLGGQAQLQTISDYIIGTSGITPGAPLRFLLEDIYFNRQIYNRTTAPVTVKIYLVKARRDQWYSATTPMVFTSTNPGGQVYPWLGEPISCIQQGYNAQANQGPGNTTYLQPSVVPEDVDMFKKYYSVVHTEEICLAEGGNHTFKLHIKYDKLLDSSVYSNTPLTGLDGLTYFMFMRCVGAPVYNATQDITTLAPVEIGAIDQYDFKFTQCWSPIIATKLTGTSTYTTGDVLRVINPGSGQAEVLQVS